MRIHQLPPAVANQIAAGEVIERPASIVKELLENAFDAGANVISVEVGHGGLNQIKIIDNGVGIVAEDLPLAIAAHATSKISKLDDLYAIESMGFRGEALASIASVAKLSIISKPVDQEHAMMLRMQGNDINLVPCARALGTTIDVVDIFYNAPVRKRFLKSKQLEFQAIETVIKRFALSAPHISISVKHDGKQVLTLPAAVNEQAKLVRISKIFGSSFMQDAVYLDVEAGGMRLYGWTSGPAFQRSQNDRMWVYINQRMVKDKLINHALKQSYEGLLHPGRFPACLLYFSIEHKEVDVNVHPTKHEVRFTQPRLVHDFFTSQLSKALHATDVTDTKVSQYSIQVCETPVSFAREIAVPTGISSHHHNMETSWVFLNNTYVLIFLNQYPYVVNVFIMYQHYVLQQLQKLTLPLASRPLLVPVKHALSGQLNYSSAELVKALAQLGIQIEFVGNEQLIIRSIPVQFPYLDIQLFLNSLIKLEYLEFEELLQILSSAQSFDPRSLSLEERLELQMFLLASNINTSFSKKITEEDCRMLLHV